ncbi:hypothetical protein IEQ34_012978 [Dendrobium chrysotoxum]|uniref:Uncharacterized protein n=1 Tax=Dendrobium chrysotoxum TaxID=161865 RepID=A0AAV7GPS9_DENCH|nr:hypothetical protein IEQ34_012978 [Dendrobium chrysotoxum]
MHRHRWYDQIREPHQKQSCHVRHYRCSRIPPLADLRHPPHSVADPRHCSRDPSPIRSHAPHTESGI